MGFNRLSAAYLNGDFTYDFPCFAESWMRATQNNEPSPYGGQSASIKRTFAGTAMNATQKMLLFHGIGTNGNNIKYFNSWTVFGDPTLMIRTRTPQTMYHELLFLL